MIDIAVQELNKYYGSNHVIKGISFEIFKGEKAGLIGKNGSGKSTLFKVLSGKEGYESGSVMKASGARIEVLEQIPVFDDGCTVENVLRSAFEELFIISEEMRRLEIQIQNSHEERKARQDYSPQGSCDTENVTDTDKLLARYGRLQTQYEAMGGYEFESKIDRICTGMKIDEGMRHQSFIHLSGGEQTRVNLARILLRDADILLLDEPTNHLDLGSIHWVEEFLKSYTGTVVVISHDRCFLDNVVTRIIEIDDGGLNFYEGNYSYYAVEKERRLCAQRELYEQQQKKIGQLEAAAKRMHEWARNADNAALHKRAFNIEKRIERMDRVDKPVVTKKITAEFKESDFSSAGFVQFKNIGKSYNGNMLFHGINLDILRNDRIALIGVNGCGKTTLIKLLTGDEAPDCGDIKIENSVKLAYLPQVIEFDDTEATVLDTIRYALEINEEKARKILAAFHFRGADVLKKAGKLSGGEKSRLKLCILMQKDCNFLVMDEPTNHLDIPSREWIEEAVEQFDGTILFISHDRYFISKFTTRVWEMEQGAITDYQGSFQEYSVWKRDFAETVETLAVKNAAKSLPGKSAGKSTGKSRTAGLSNRKQDTSAEQQKKDVNQKECMDIESRIMEMESKLKDICNEMITAASDADRLNTLYNEKIDAESSIELLYSRWAELNVQ